MSPSCIFISILLVCCNTFLLSSSGPVPDTRLKVTGHHLWIWDNKENSHYLWSPMGEIWGCPSYFSMLPFLMDSKSLVGRPSCSDWKEIDFVLGFLSNSQDPQSCLANILPSAISSAPQECPSKLISTTSGFQMHRGWAQVTPMVPCGSAQAEAQKQRH